MNRRIKKLFCLALCPGLVLPCLCADAAAQTADPRDSSAGSVYSSLPDTEQPSPLRFNSDGTFKIIHLCDIQDIYPMNATTREFIGAVLDEERPDLVILGGDNTVAPAADKDAAIGELCGLFTSRGIYFSLVFGNHDHEQGVCDDELLVLYQKHGGDLCLAYDQSPALTGTATHHLPIASSDSSGTAFNLWLFDSNEYEGRGDGSVCADQTAWYAAKSAELARANGGKPVPAMAFQHIVMRNVMDAIFYRLPTADKGNEAYIRYYEDCAYSLYLRRVTAYSGFIHETPCAGYYDHGTLDAMKSSGDVLAVFSGHDHICDYKIRVKGIELINTPGCSYHSYGKDIMRGCRRIVIDENKPSDYTAEMITVASYAARKGSPLVSLGDITRGQALRAVVGRAVVNLLHNALNLLDFTRHFRGR